MIRNLQKKFIEKGYAHILCALLIETSFLILVSFAGLFTLETILPGLISGRFVVGKLIIAVTLLLFFTAFLGEYLGISFPNANSRSLRIILIIGSLWTLSILAISLLSFPPWSIPLFLVSFGTIGYFFYKEIGK